MQWRLFYDNRESIAICSMRDSHINMGSGLPFFFILSPTAAYNSTSHRRSAAHRPQQQQKTSEKERNIFYRAEAEIVHVEMEMYASDSDGPWLNGLIFYWHPCPW